MHKQIARKNVNEAKESERNNTKQKQQAKHYLTKYLVNAMHAET